MTTRNDSRGTTNVPAPAVPSSTSHGDSPRPTLLQRAALALAGSVGLNLALFAIVTMVGGVTLLHPEDFGQGELVPVVAVDVVVSCVFGVVLATVAALVLRRLAPRPRAWFVGLAVAGAVLAVGGPFSIEGAPTSTLLAFLTMHMIVPAITIPLLAASLPRRR